MPLTVGPPMVHVVFIVRQWTVIVSDELYRVPLYACTVILCVPAARAIDGVVTEAPFVAVYLATPSTQTFIYCGTPPLLNEAVTTSGDGSVVPLAGELMLTLGVPGGGVPVATVMLTLCWPMAPELSQTFATTV